MTNDILKVAIVGFGLQGQSAANYWHSLGASVTVCDQDNVEVPEWAHRQTGNNHRKGLKEFDLIIRSPSVRPDSLAEDNDESILKKVTSTTNEFFKVCPTNNIIGVTGTKGKGTTSTLIAEIIKKTGRAVHLGGNIGTDPLELLKNDIKPDDWVVLELANFQLIDIKYSPKIGVCLMVVPEHLDWHKDIDEYYTAKKQLFRWQTKEDFAIYNALNYNSLEVVKDSIAKKLTYDVPHPPYNIAKHHNGAYCEHDEIFYQSELICNVDDIALHGRHNIENVCAAIAATWDVTNGNIPAIVSAIKDFKGLEHRIEFVDEVDGIAFYNDSFATTPEATIAAIKAMDKPKVLILGGSDKGIELTSVINEILQSNVRHVIAIGETGRTMAQGLKRHHYPHITEGLTDMEEIVATARDKAIKGDAVLLSTASASFGLFDNYKDRGNQFKHAVQEL